MDASNALIFALGVYVLTLIVALFVVVVIVGIRRITADKPQVASAVQSVKKEATA